MGKLIVTEFITLDGAAQSPEGPLGAPQLSTFQRRGLRQSTTGARAAEDPTAGPPENGCHHGSELALFVTPGPEASILVPHPSHLRTAPIRFEQNATDHRRK